MATKWSNTLIPTARQAPADAVVPSHQLMIRAGLIHKLGSGVYTYLPLGLRALQKAMQIVREEMDKAGAVEVLMPTLQPIELWEQTKRREAYGDNLFVVKDRHGRVQALGPTHEEIITDLCSTFIESYRDLPKTLYQIQTKFRDEFRPRFGVLRSREFQMKDAYSFHLNLDGPGGLSETYDKQYAAYCRIFERCGVPYQVVEAEAGPIGGNASHEFMVPSPTGEDFILKSDKDNYAANVEKCEIGTRASELNADPTGELEAVKTPGCPGIEDVCTFFKKQLKTKLKTQNMLKTLVCKSGDTWVIGIIRGDHELNEGKIRRISGFSDLEMADEKEAREAGFAIGFVGPHVAIGRNDIKLFVDHDAAQGGFWVTGANEIDHHVKHFNWKRDLTDAGVEVTVADIRNAVDGDPSPKNDGGVLQMTKGIEIGHVFKLGDKYTKALNVQVVNEANERVTPIMGCYGIGVNRILASAIEREGGNDENGIIWPKSIAPYQVVITPIKYEGQAAEVADKLAVELEANGIDVLIDDRDERPGVKFKDADLIGIPYRITLGDKALAEQSVELKARDGSNGPKGELVKIDAVVSQLVDALKS
jgi:prolyl-tRNA synthetase